MISKLLIKQFRQLKNVTIDLGQVSLCIGPNNSGKTSILQAISLFGIGYHKWLERHHNNSGKVPRDRAGIAIPISELINIPVIEGKDIWNNKKTRNQKEDKKGTDNIYIEVHAEGVNQGKQWQLGFIFHYQNTNTIYVNLAKQPNNIEESYIFEPINENIGYFPSVASVSLQEDKYEKGSILRYIGEGNPNRILRNICYYLLVQDKEHTSNKWHILVETIRTFFSITLQKPIYNAGSGLLTMSYKANDIDFDISSLGSGAKQTIGLFSYILAFPNTILLLDEPDAHLEIIHQKNIYSEISKLIRENNSQLIVASHSETVLAEATQNKSDDVIIQCLPNRYKTIPHDNIKAIKSILREIDISTFLVIQQKKKIFYTEGSTDINMLKAFAKKLGYTQFEIIINNVYRKEVSTDKNLIYSTFQTFYSLLEEDCKGYALLDNGEKPKGASEGQKGLKFYYWKRNEIENYLNCPKVLRKYVEINYPLSVDISKHNNLFAKSENNKRSHQDIMEEIIQKNTTPNALENLADDYWITTKVTDHYLDKIFRLFFQEIGNLSYPMSKATYYQLVEFMDIEDINEEVKQVIEDIINTLN